MQGNLFSDLGSPDYKRFLDYHHENPQIYEFFKKFALQAIQKGHKNLSAEFVYNIIRWETPISGEDDYKVNNNYKAFYSRMFMREFPQYDGFFRKRKSKADEVNSY